MRSSRKKRFDEAEEIADRNIGVSITLPSIFLADLSKVYRKTHECRVFLTVKLSEAYPQDYINEFTI